VTLRGAEARKSFVRKREYVLRATGLSISSRDAHDLVPVRIG